MHVSPCTFGFAVSTSLMENSAIHPIMWSVSCWAIVAVPISISFVFQSEGGGHGMVTFWIRESLVRVIFNLFWLLHAWRYLIDRFGGQGYSWIILFLATDWCFLLFHIFSHHHSSHLPFILPFLVTLQSTSPPLTLHFPPSFLLNHFSNNVFAQQTQNHIFSSITKILT